MARTSGFGVSPRVALSNVAASTPLACAGPRRPARHSEKLAALASAEPKKRKHKARRTGNCRMDVRIFREQFHSVEPASSLVNWVAGRAALGKLLRQGPRSGGKQTVNFVHEVLEMKRFREDFRLRRGVVVGIERDRREAREKHHFDVRV